MDELTVRRLKVVDASGAGRLLLTGKPIPEGMIAGLKLPNPGGPRQSAGLLFYNDDGDEQGGLTYNGTQAPRASRSRSTRGRKTRRSRFGLATTRMGAIRTSRETIFRKRSWFPSTRRFCVRLPGANTRAERDAVKHRYRHSRKFGRERFVVGERAGVSQFRLDDDKGRPRLRLTVTPEGKAAIEFLDEFGKITKVLTGR